MPPVSGANVCNKFLQGLGVRDMDKDLDSVGVRRQSRRPPNAAMLSLIRHGSLQAKPQPSQHRRFVVGSEREFADQIRSPPYTARSFIAAKHWDHKL